MGNVKKEPGAFVISLDFEIMWGVRDKPSIRSYYLKNLLGVREVIPALLDVFTGFGIHATFATVGMLFASSKEELFQYLLRIKPSYKNPYLSPYYDLDMLGKDEVSDPLHYAGSLINLIKETPNQEIGCHTFCHYYCLEEGQTPEAFASDIEAAKAIAQTKGILLKSLVFPRNQFNETYLQILQQNGFTSFRGNERSWIYEARNRDKESRIRRLIRLMDTYVNISGNNMYSWAELLKSAPLYNIPASRFLGPFNTKLKKLENARLKRILDDMTAAAKQKAVYHLWWHPHNFGVHLQENLQFLRSILAHYQLLHQQYGFQSLTMQEAAHKLAEYRNASV